MECFVVTEFLLTSASRSPSAIAEPLVVLVITGNEQKMSGTTSLVVDCTTGTRWCDINWG